MFLRDTDVAARYRVKRATIWGWLKKDATFPRPVKLSGGTTRWRLSDLEKWDSQADAQESA